ncbi:MAG TPA: class I SAM-dependent methyltransferase [Alphaproteobacteria bacterium]
MHTGLIARWFGRGSPRRRPRLSERLFNRFALIYYGRNLALDLQLAAKRESVKYIQRHMRQAMLVRDRWDLLDFALSRAPAEGMILEFGVERGDSLRHLSRRTDRTVHGFDSFQGLPEDWHGTFEKRGKFSTAGRLPAVPDNARLHVGWFSDVLPDFLARHNEPAALVHIDCDLYSSSKAVLDLLADRLAPGSVIVFDEYFNYPNWQEHEFRAFQEFVDGRQRKYEYLAFAAKNGHVAVRLI